MEVFANVPLKPFNSLALPGVAEYLCRVESDQDLHRALEFAHANGLLLTLLGGGSNTVINGDVKGLVLVLATKGIALVGETAEDVRVRVAAGENWHRLVDHCLNQGWYGLENLALIPGSAGAAPIQNIGAYGVELAGFLHSVDLVDIESGQHRAFLADECELRYRDSVFKHRLRGRVVITAITLRLWKSPRVNLGYPELAKAVEHVENPSPRDVFDAVCALRRAKLPDPETLPNAGSFFKNPVLDPAQGSALIARYPDIPRYPQADGSIKFPAAWLIDRAGWKGHREAHVGVHERQALVLVHYGQGQGSELIGLADRIANDILAKYGIRLEMEPVVAGRGY